MAKDLEFKIDVWTPETLPQQRLGEYMIEAARLYGESNSVHFQRLRKGSAILVSRVADTAKPKVVERLRGIRTGQAPADARSAYEKLDAMLATDNAVGLVRGIEQGVVVRFPGRDRPRPVEYVGIREQGILDGEIIRIGGRDETVHLSLQTGDAVLSAIDTDREMGRRLGPLIFGPTIRLLGMGTWRRSEDGLWSLDRFKVSSFEVLEDRPLADAVREIRELRGSTWGSEPDPVSAALDARHGDQRAR